MSVETLIVRQEGGVVFAEIAAPPMNLLGPELVRDLVLLIQHAEADDAVRVIVFKSADPDYFISHVDLTKVPEYRAEAAKLTGEASIALLFRHLSASRTVTPRRAYCQRCEATHVLLPAWAVPRRRDGAEVIGEALVCKAQGLGHRRIAARLARPPATVRGWLRAFARRGEIVVGAARRWTHAIAASELGHSRPAGSPLAEAVDALGIVARACRLRLGMTASPWELAVALTGLLHGSPRDPPGF